MTGRSAGGVPALALVLWCALILHGCQDLGIRDTQSLLVPALKRSEVVGLLAGLGTTCASLPDLLAMLRRRSSIGMNPRMAGIMAVFQVVWVYYGLLIASRPVIVWNAVAILTNALTVVAFLHFAREDKRRAREAADARGCRAPPFEEEGP